MAITKYQNREGYSHRDILRLSHPSTKDPLLCFLFDQNRSRLVVLPER